MSSNFPYTPGSAIWLRSSNNQMFEAKIIEVKSVTLSCVMVIQRSSSPDLNILKLYDRRFSQQLREQEEAAPWDTQLEDHYREFIQSGRHHEFFDRWSAESQENPYWEVESCEQWEQATLEGYLQFFCQRTFDIEKHAYDLMHDIQGIHVPKLYGKVTLCSSLSSTSETPDRYLDCPGILLQYIPGFPLTDLAEHVAPQYWQDVCERAIDIILQIGDRGICNRDVKTRSFILTPHDFSVPSIFMTDFGFCFFKDQAGDEREFRYLQAHEDEEGAIGCVMERALKGQYSYRPSERSERLADEFMRED